uniref:Arf-GAP domain-containing protein n=1 Tax=Chenopodium quinoa TaxID=63459 RepID=A0A803LL82_CHEQI
MENWFCLQILEGLLKLPENKKCADCRSKAPRWASINLGIFICLQCSGIHRSLGVHISKVRSTTLDTWLPEQVALMQAVGNDKSNAYWEAELPVNYDSNQIENFIHAKYVEKRWIPRESKARLISSSRSKEQLTSSRSTRRFGAIAEWTNNQHICKERRDCSTAERDNRESSSPSNTEDLTGNKNEHQQQEKKENCQPSMKYSTLKSKSVNGIPTEPAQVIPRILPNASLWKSEQEQLKIKSSTANAMTAVPSSKADPELFITLSMDDSSDNDSSFDTSSWVHFDSDQESSTSEGKVVPSSAVEKASIHEPKLNLKSSESKVNTEPTTGDVLMMTAPFSNGNSGEHQKYVTNDNQSHRSEKPNMVSSPSVHLQRLALLAEGVSSTNAPTSAGSIHHQTNVNENGVVHTIGTQMPVQNSQTVKSSMNSTPYTISSLYTPAIPLRRVSTAPSRRPPAALPVSGYDYDFSFLTQGMFTKR